LNIFRIYLERLIELDQKKSLNAIDNLLLTLWGIGIFSAIMIIFAMLRIGFHDAKEIAPLIGAFAILISAGLASISMMKSIFTTKINDQEKSEKEKERKRIFALNVMKTIQVTLGIFSNKAKKQYMHKIGLRDSDSEIDFDSDIQTTGKLLNSVFCESILPYLNDEEQNIISNFYIEYYRFLAAYNKEENISLSTKASLANLAKRPTKKLPEYLNMFSNFAQSYIDLNTQTNKEKNA